MLRYLTIPKFAAESGYSQDAIRTKIRDAIWREGQEWRRAPDGRILVDVDGYHRWVEGAPVLKVGQRPAPRGRSLLFDDRPRAPARTWCGSPGAVSAVSGFFRFQTGWSSPPSRAHAYWSELATGPCITTVGESLSCVALAAGARRW